MIDISATGAKIQIETGDGSCTITRFSDEGTPFECQDVDVSDNKKNLNGEMISSRTPATYSISVTVIPGSDEDKFLTKLLAASSLQPGNVQSIEKITVKKITLVVPEQNASSETISSGRTYSWSVGRMKSGPTGPSTSAEGRMSSRTFSFEMERFSPPGGK